MPWIIITTIVQILAIILIILSLKQTGVRDFLGFKYKQEASISKPLEVKGFYAIIRHPLYLGGLVILWFSPVMTENSLLVSACLTIYLLLGTLLEEGRLRKKFGDDYIQYQRHVPMLIPRLKGNKNK